MPYQIKNGIVYGSNAVSLTQAQYDALSSTEKNNGTVYYITDSDAVLDASDVGLGSGTVEDLAGSVAVIETSPTTATHAVGSYLVYNGQLYKVISAISAGATLTPNTNIEATTAGTELTSLNNGLNTFVKTITFTATTSANGNVSLESYLNTYQYLIISVSAHLKSTPTSSIVCLPYQYAGNGSGRICGIHCVDETANSNAIASTPIEGTIFFIKKQ